MSTLVWTKQKPTLPGFYFFRMLDTACSVQLPHVRQLALVDDELHIIEPDIHPVAELSDDFEYAGPITEPVEQGRITEPVEKETPLNEEPVTKTERQSFATMIAQQQEQIDKLIKASNANSTGALRLCDHVLDLNSRLDKKISKGELDERSSEIRKQVLEGFAHMADTLVKILNER